MKLSEARIMIYLDNTRRDIRYAAQIALKLDIDDSNVNKILKKMAAKEWVKLSIEDGKNIYTITSKCPIQEANELHIYTITSKCPIQEANEVHQG